MQVEGDGFSVGSGLKFDLGVYEGDRPSTDTPMEIPKNIPDGVYSVLNVPSSFPVTEVDVTLDIAHGDISELRVVLYGPDNTLVILHDQTGAGVSGIHTTYDDLTQPATGSMDDFVGKDPQGNWRIRIQDYVGQGTQAGTLEGWTLHFKSDTPFDCNPVGCGESVPPAVGDTLDVQKSGATDVVVSWSAVGGASNYNVWRSATPQMTTAENVGTTSGTSLTDIGAQTLAGPHYYVVRSVNGCRWESP
jgi:subtilisin-like proprotein convertase family protein